MSRSMALYNALSAISVPPEKAKAVVEAWEAEVRNVATKSDLVRVEKQLIQKTVDLGRDLRGSSKELGDTVKTHGEQINALSQAIVTQGIELRAEIKEQGNDLRASIEKQGNDFWLAMEKQSNELRAEIKEQSNELRTEIKEQGSEFRRAIETQGYEFRLSMEKQGRQTDTPIKAQETALNQMAVKLENALEQQGIKLEAAIKSVESKFKYVHWQLSVIVTAVVGIGIKVVNDFLIGK
ncbi:hypothetical protein [Pseudomonas gingeri]|uniref:Uncharacterized protein n=1 Tax=Pseudomonas gingeri TaxID=117681 RepID=A0A7Y7WYI6_9PSED|nr:hypothetical protein [Pseudomonas gingeri]NWB88872.1 hypothetical protein [Pseudomonas gingeri]